MLQIPCIRRDAVRATSTLPTTCGMFVRSGGQSKHAAGLGNATRGAVVNEQAGAFLTPPSDTLASLLYASDPALRLPMTPKSPTPRDVRPACGPQNRARALSLQGCQETSALQNKQACIGRITNPARNWPKHDQHRSKTRTRLVETSPSWPEQYQMRSKFTENWANLADTNPNLVDTGQSWPIMAEKHNLGPSQQTMVEQNPNLLEQRPKLIEAGQNWAA